MKEIVRLGLILLAISFVAAVALKFTEQITAEPIAKQIAEASELSRKAVMPEADAFEPIKESQLESLKAEYPILREAYVSKVNGSINGYVVKTAPKGFAGPIEVTTGISIDGKITGVRVGTNTETPGLGDIAAKEPFYSQYTGKSSETEVGVNKIKGSDTEIQALTGATITSKAVTLGVNTATKVVKAVQ